MSLSIEQISAVSYPAVLADMRKPANQWAQNAALDALQKMGFIQKVSLGDNIELPVDYRPNPDTAVLASDQDTAALLKTEVLTSASYAIGQLNVPVTWTKGDEAKNPSENQKIALVKSLLENAINSHDDLLEQLIFTTSSAGGDEILGLDTLVPTSGAGSPGGISATTETWWANYQDTYTDETDIEATATTVYNEAAKGTGATLVPKIILSGSAPQVLFESGLQAMQRFGPGDKGNAGFDALLFKNVPWVFSQYGGTKVYFLNPKNYQMVVSKEYFRDKGNTNEIQGQNAFYFLIYSALQFVTNNKSRLAVMDQA